MRERLRKHQRGGCQESGSLSSLSGDAPRASSQMGDRVRWHHRVRIINPKMLQAKKFAQSGFAVLPLYEPTGDSCACGNPNCPHAGKHPRTPNGVKDATTDLNVVDEWWTRWPSANIGIATGAVSNLTVVDLDGKDALEAFRRISGLAVLPPKATIVTGRGHHVYYRPDGLAIGNSASKLAPGIDVRGEGGYVIAHGSRHASGVTYRLWGWSAGCRIIAPEPIPGWLAALVRSTPNEVATAVAKHDAATLEYGAAALRGEVAKVLGAIVGQRNDTLNASAFKLGQLCAAGELGEDDVVEQLTRAASFIGLSADEAGPTIQSGLTAGRRNPRSPSVSSASDESNGAARIDEDPLAEELAKLPNTDAANAERLQKRHEGELQWTPGHGWYCFDGKIWVPDGRKHRLTLALDTAKKIDREASFTNDELRRKHALNSQSKAALDRMVSLAEPRLARADAALDADPWKLAVANGVLDLKTAELSAHAASHLITRVIPTEFDAAATCPRFDAFLRHALKGDDDLIAFVQKAVGLCLTGSNREQVFFVVHGPGGTGKSTFLNLIRDMLGTYAMHTATETWLASNKNQSTQPDLARLQGARMVTAIEANFDQQLDEAKLKGVTGGEPITCRGLYQSTFEYVPQFKLWFAVNDLPAARSTAESFWRRARVISFDVAVAKEEQDLDLDNKLRAEFPGILAWAVRGCTAWQRDGLAPPSAVGEATAKWQVKVDHLTRFVREALIRDPSSTVQSSFVHTHYSEWCARRGEKPMSTKAFKAALIKADFKFERTQRSFWRGMRLRTE